MNEPLLAARGLTKNYTMARRTLEVLRGVDLTLSLIHIFCNHSSNASFKLLICSFFILT